MAISLQNISLARIALLILVAPLVGIGCAKQSASSDGANSASAVYQQDQLSGTWTACENSGTEAIGYSFNFTNPNFVLSFSGYENASCGNLGVSQPAITIGVIGSYVIGDASSTVTGATNITTTVGTTIQLTAYDQSDINTLNSEAACGFSNWQSGVPQTLDLTEACAANLKSVVAPFQQIVSNIVVFKTDGVHLDLGLTGTLAIDTSDEEVLELTKQ